MRILSSFLIIICCLGCPLVWGQGLSIDDTEPKVQKQFKKATRALRSGKLEKALTEYEKMLRKHSNLIEPHFRISGIHLERGDLALAEDYLRRGIDLDPAPRDAHYFTLGNVQRLQGKYAEAADQFAYFLARSQINDPRFRKAKKYEADCRFAAKAILEPVPFEPKALSSAINSPDSEYLPSFTADEQAIVFTRRRGGAEDFYISAVSDTGFVQAQPLEALNTTYNEGAHCLSADGTLLVYTVCNTRSSFGSCDLFYSEKKADGWTRSRNMGMTVNSASWDAQPTLSSDGQTLYFSSRRPGGMGGSDIWMSARNADGSWSAPTNVGAPINTPGHDESPFLHADNQTLYFRSNAHPGMGKFDIFLCRFDREKQAWGGVQNLGYPINTSEDEGALFVRLDGQYAYFASDRNTSAVDHPGKQNLDIFEFELHEKARPKTVTYVRALVTDQSTGAPLNAHVEVVDLSNQAMMLTKQTDASGSFLVCLPIGKKYLLSAGKEGYTFQTEHFALDSARSKWQPFEMEITLMPIPPVKESAPNTTTLPSTPIILKNIFFETGSAALKAESTAEIDRLAKLLTDHAHVHIQILGHTDNVGSAADNMHLSTARAQAVYEALAARGIAKSRLSFVGMGEDAPIDSNESEEGRRNNRRTEFVIQSQ